MFPTLPPQPLLRTIATRVVVVFVALRVLAAGVGSYAGFGFAAGLEPSVAGVLWTWGAVVLSLRIDLARRAELVLLANLGYGSGRIAAFAVAECAALELLFRAVV